MLVFVLSMACTLWSHMHVMHSQVLPKSVPRYYFERRKH